MRTTLPLLFGFVVGFFMLGDYFIPHWSYQLVKGYILEFGTLLASTAFLLGIINLIQVNLPKIIAKEKDWFYKAIMLLSMVVTMLFGFAEGEARMDEKQVYKWIYDYIFTPLSATMFALLAFYIASAAFRAFRARNADATILLTAACLMMIATVPIGEQIPFFGEYLLHLKSWVMDVPNVSTRRAIFVGAALGTISTGLRILLGIERSHLGGD